MKVLKTTFPKHLYDEILRVANNVTEFFGVEICGEGRGLVEKKFLSGLIRSLQKPARRFENLCVHNSDNILYNVSKFYAGFI